MLLFDRPFISIGVLFEDIYLVTGNAEDFIVDQEHCYDLLIKMPHEVHFRPLFFVSKVKVATLAEEYVFLNAEDLLEEAHSSVLLCNRLADSVFKLVSCRPAAELDTLTAVVLPLVHRELEACLALHSTASLHQESLVGDVDVRAKGALLANLDLRLRLFMKV